MNTTPHGHLGRVLGAAVTITSLVLLAVLWSDRHSWVGWLPALSVAFSDYFAVLGGVVAAATGAWLAMPLTEDQQEHRRLLSVRPRHEITRYLLRWHLAYAFGTTAMVLPTALLVSTVLTGPVPAPLPWWQSLVWALSSATWVCTLGLAGSLIGWRYPRVWAPLAAAALGYLAHLAYSSYVDAPEVTYLFPLTGLAWAENGPTPALLLMRCLVAGAVLALCWFLVSGRRRFLAPAAGTAALGATLLSAAPFMPPLIADRPTIVVCTETSIPACAPDWASAGLPRYAALVHEGLAGLPDALQPEAIAMTPAVAWSIRSEDVMVVSSPGGRGDATALPEVGPTIAGLGEAVFLQGCGQGEVPEQVEAMQLWLTGMGYSGDDLLVSGLQGAPEPVLALSGNQERSHVYTSWDDEQRQAYWARHAESVRTCTVTADMLEEITS
ncbi:hypothetical protein [Micrococcus lylae]|nr:hypothetical protein [Micrococcus lylae]